MQVEQIDREAGADFMGSIPAFYGQEQPMRDGLHDTSLIVQAFARHRATQLQALAARVKVLEAENMMLREERDRLINFVNIMCEEYGLEYDGVVKQ